MGNVTWNRVAAEELYGMGRQERQRHHVKVTGLKNSGSTCYMNCLIQSFFVTPMLRIQLNECQLLENKIVADLQDIFMNLERGLRSVDTYNLANSLNHLNWTVNKQQDLEEFFQMVINAINVEDVRKVYEVALLDSLTCLRCNTETTTTLSYLDISLPLSMDSSAQLEGVLQHFLEEEDMKGEDKPFCEKCKTKQVMRKKSSFVTLPQVLVIHLNRFVYDIQHQRHVKLEKPVDIPHTLRFKKDSVGYVPVCQTDENLEEILRRRDRNPDKDPGYERFKLFSICVHCGDVERGHYYAYIRHHENDQWYLCNDSAVRKTDWSYIREKLRMKDARNDSDVIWRNFHNKVQSSTNRHSTAILLMYERCL
ncbi:ubiquitin carboxyl-terminal hydrolase 47-like isoform X1 [Erpetoichthys calabaricus]|uniref:ubiquitin carboxyl-terminal hydrolase 47-like isoform X1 n=1 Tax=Erpetoichthys calabaricus TaxID=27687 RepID=UPI0022347B6D|nr:ubiquitin carboxyl-terminal hydrolase 47-like isoform X1 [Erpetoichthys calabaricus]